MFIDRARVFVKAGDGGMVCLASVEKNTFQMAALVAAMVVKADVIFKADKNINTLVDFRYKRQFKAPAGGNGESSISMVAVPIHLLFQFHWAP